MRTNRNAPPKPKTPKPKTECVADATAPARGRYPLSPEEEDMLRREIVQRLLALRCRQPLRCRRAVCRRSERCQDRMLPPATSKLA